MLKALKFLVMWQLDSEWGCGIIRVWNLRPGDIWAVRCELLHVLERYQVEHVAGTCQACVLSHIIQEQFYNVEWMILWLSSLVLLGWVGLWGFLWWAPSAKRKDLHGVSSGWSSVWHRSNTGLSSTQYEQIPIILGVWPFWLTPFFFRSISFWRAYG